MDSGMPAASRGSHARKDRMNDELLGSIDREVLGWPGVSKDPGGRNATVYRFGRRQIGHIHHDGVADLQFPRAVHDELISNGRAQPHRGSFPAVVSYHIRVPEDVPGALDLFRLNYDRAKAAAAADAGNPRRG